VAQHHASDVPVNLLAVSVDNCRESRTSPVFILETGDYIGFIVVVSCHVFFLRYI
jgi:hypothetical protein